MSNSNDIFKTRGAMEKRQFVCGECVRVCFFVRMREKEFVSGVKRERENVCVYVSL